MAIFDSNVIAWLTYYIVLKEKERVAQYEAEFPQGYQFAPSTGAAVAFAAPYISATAAKSAAAPYTYSDWDGKGLPDADDAPFPTNVATFERHTGGFWGIGGRTIRYKWVGRFVLAGNPAGPTEVPGPEQAEIPARRWVEGFETPGIGGALSAAAVSKCSKDAARHAGGMGFAIRSFNNNYATAILNTYTPALTNGDTASWERFYIRLRRMPTASSYFWRTNCFPSSGVGTLLAITAEGQIAIYTDTGTTKTLVATVPGVTLEEWSGRMDEDAWHRIDVLLNTGFAAPDVPTFRLYIDGALVSSVGAVGGIGTKHYSSSMGNPVAVASDLDLDVDDWINAAVPHRDIGGGSVENLTGKDFTNGSKVALIRPTGFNAAHSGSWTGDYRVLAQNACGVSTFTPAELTSSTASALCAINTDSAQVLDGDPGAIGVVSMQIVALSRGPTNGVLGYTLAGGAAVDAAMSPAQGPTNTAGGMLYTVATITVEGDNVTIPDATPIVLRHKKGTGVGAAGLSTLMAQVEMIGKFNRCDYPVADLAGISHPVPLTTGAHNYPYPRSPWARRGAAAPISPYYVKGGTYVGNGTGQDLPLKAPIHWLLIRPVGVSNTGGFLWFSTMQASHAKHQQGTQPSVVDCLIDPAFVGASGEDAQQQQYLARIAGNDSQINALGITYQYIAVGDPGMRYLLTGHLAHRATDVARTRPLALSEFEPQFGMFLGENASATTTRTLHAKGPGQAAASIVRFETPGVVTNAITWATGGLVTEANAHALASGEGLAYALWRLEDGNQSPHAASVYNAGSYTGDGAASRTINLAPATGKRLLFAMVFAESAGAGIQRDPSHTLTNSSNHSGTDLTTGITAGGLDSFTVGSSLNTNGVVFTYFVLFASADCISSGGWGCNGDYFPPEPEPPGDPEWPPDPGDPNPEPDPEDPDDIPPLCPLNDPDCINGDTSAACKSGTTAMTNRALARIGVSKQIVDITTDTGIEAQTALLVYGTAVNETLRAFPWPFATRFTLMPVVGGTSTTPVNSEWQYSYRRPGDCVFARRITATRGGAVDPVPPPFEQGQDSVGGLIYTNVASARLEYTARPSCASASVDALFREALCWRLAAALAIPLSRMADRAVQCLAGFQNALREAEATLRPGKPGTLGTVTVDPLETLKRQIVNIGLLRIGANTIAQFQTDQSREAQAARLVFEDEYRKTLEDYPWTWATGYAELVLAGGAVDDKANADWTYRYELPSDHLFARRLVTDVGRRWDPEPPLFRVGRGLNAAADADVPVLFTDLESTEAAPVTLEYTKLALLSASSTLYRDALAWRLAATLAPTLGSVDTDQPEQLGRGPDPDTQSEPRRVRRIRSDVGGRHAIAARAWAQYQYVLLTAKAADAQQQQQDKFGDAKWIDGR